MFQSNRAYALKMKFTLMNRAPNNLTKCGGTHWICLCPVHLYMLPCKRPSAICLSKPFHNWSHDEDEMRTRLTTKLIWNPFFIETNKKAAQISYDNVATMLNRFKFRNMFECAIFNTVSMLLRCDAPFDLRFDTFPHAFCTLVLSFTKIN